MVIAIISILAAMLLPGLGRARDSAKVVKCVSNLRQMGFGLLSYCTDYNEWAVGYTWLYGDTSRSWASFLSRPQRLYPKREPCYLGYFNVEFAGNGWRRSYVHCPVGKYVNQSTYMPHREICQNKKITIDRKKGFVFMNSIRKPARLAWFGDAYDFGNLRWWVPRHQGNKGLNYLFFDGHAETMKQSNLKVFQHSAYRMPVDLALLQPNSFPADLPVNNRSYPFSGE